MDPRLSLKSVSNRQLLGRKVKRRTYLVRSATEVSLGPLLFLVYVNDLHQPIEKSNIIMYADDTVFLLSDKNETEIDKAINYEAKLLHNWL